jgi:hypothetical protein
MIISYSLGWYIYIFCCKEVKNLILPNDLRKDDPNVFLFFRMNRQNPDTNRTVTIKKAVGCVSGSYKDMKVAVNVVALVPIYSPLFLCADIDVNSLKKGLSYRESKLTFRARMSAKCQDFVFKLRCHVSR